MAINPVGGAASAAPAMQLEALEKRAPNGQEAKIDGDSDDRGGAAVKPTVNTQGQPIGTILNTKA